MTKRCILIISIFTCLLATTPSIVFAQSVAKEFQLAREKWVELRSATFNDCAIAVETQMIDSYSDESQKDFSAPRTIKTRHFLFATKSLKYFENIPLSDTETSQKIPFNHRLVNIHNEKEAFLVSKPPTGKWELKRKEEGQGKLTFNKESITPGWYSRNRGIADGIMHSFSADPRLMLGRTAAIDYSITSYLKFDKKCFQDFKVRKDKFFGRVVSVQLVLDSELKAAPRRRSKTPAKKLQVRGKLEFLADWNWLPLSMKITYKRLDSNDQVITTTQSTVTMKYAREPFEAQIKSGELAPHRIFPQQVIQRSTSKNTGKTYESILQIRNMSKKEIEAIRRATTLKDFVDSR